MAKSNLLVISEGAPPLADNLVEGGGLRAWGIAKGAAQNGYEVTLAYQDVYKLPTKRRVTPPDNLKITTWNEKSIHQLISDHSHILFSYAMGQAPLFLQSLRANHILILDCYVPITIEVAARNSKDLHTEFVNYTNTLPAWENVLRRGDYFLAASEQQKNYYLGYLSSINRINPLTYASFEERLLHLPYGLSKEDAPNTIRLPKTPTLLWYGGFYPWFDMVSLAKSIKRLSTEIEGFKFLVAGAKNPYNQNADFRLHYEKSLKALEDLGDKVEFIDWQPYHERLNVFARASAIITANHLGLENNLAWRTRLMDFLAAKKPIFTNGGDPLGEELIDRGIAVRVDFNDPSAFIKAYTESFKRPVSPAAYQEAIELYDWQRLTKVLAPGLEAGTRLTQPYFRSRLTVRGYLRRQLHYPTIVVRYIQRNGVRATGKKVKQKILGV